MLDKSYAPYRHLRRIEDLLLLRATFDTPPAALDVPKGHYPGEVLVWLDIDSPVEQLFSTEGETLFVAEADEGARGWRLCFTPHGYLRFESGEGKEQLWAESKVPLLSF